MRSGLRSSRCCRQTLGGRVGRSVIIVGWWKGSLIGSGRGYRGGICRVRSSVRGRRCGNDIAAIAGDGTWDRVLQRCWPRQMLREEVDWAVSVDATINRAHQHATNTTRPEQDTGGWVELQGSAASDVEPAGHGIGRSRGGLTTKIHHAVDGKGRPLAIVVTRRATQRRRDAGTVLGDVRVHALGAADRGLEPDAVIARQGLLVRRHPRAAARRGIKVVIPLKRDQIAARAPTRFERWPTTRRSTPNLPRPQRRRTRLRADQAVARTGHPLRQARHHLPRRSPPRRHHGPGPKY